MGSENTGGRPPGPPWQDEKVRPQAEASTGAVEPEGRPKTRGVLELAAELKNLIRGDRMRRSKRARDLL